MKNIEEMTRKLNAGEGSLGVLLKDEAFAKSLAGATDNLRTLTDHLNRGDGTAGKLLTDDALYTRLTTVTTRLAIDLLRGRRRRSANYVGPWLPEFINTPMAADPADLVSSLTVGFLMMLERLEPIERVVFLLADVFGEPFVDIASTVDRSEVACRQIASRARRRVRDPEPRRSVEPSECVRLAAAFAQAAQAGDLSGVEALLSEGAVLLSDGGATVRAARRPVVGRQRVARFVVNIAKRSANAHLDAAVLNGEPALVVSRNSGLNAPPSPGATPMSHQVCVRF